MNFPKQKFFEVFFVFLFIALFGGCTTSTSTTDTKDVRLENLTARALAILHAGLDDADPHIRANAIEAVVVTGQLDLMPKVEQLLADECVPVRFAAALAVGDTKYSSAKSVLVQISKSADENTSLAAAYALYMLGDKSKFSVMVFRLANNDMEIRANAALLLGKSGSPEAINILRQVMISKDSDDKVRLQAAESLARLKDETIYQKLWTMMLSVNADVRVLGTIAIGELGNAQARGALTTQLSDQVLEVRLVAAEQLGILGYPTGEPEVLDVFTKNLTDQMDPQEAQRINCLTALAIGHIKTPSLAKFLPKLLKNESKSVQLAAAEAVLLCQRSN
jgi:HEAT repeat protein